jgi:hypothetical protein
MSQTSESSVPATPVANVLPETTVNTPVAGGTTFIQTPNYQDALNEVENLSAFIVALKAAAANSSTWAAFQTAVAALPNA